jgi:hypothetical protein
MGASLDLAGAHRQRRLGPIEGLDAGLLVDAHHRGVLGRVHVQADDITDLVELSLVWSASRRRVAPCAIGGRSRR